VFIVAVEASSQDLGEKPSDRWTHHLSGLWTSLGTLCVNPATNCTESIIQWLVRGFNATVQEPNERHPGCCQGVADGSVATTGVPAKQPLVRQSHAGQRFGALGEGNVLRENLNHIGSTPLIQNIIGASETVRKGLAVLAVTDDSISAFGILYKSFEGAAPTLQWMVHDSGPPAENGSTLADLRTDALDLSVFCLDTDIVRHLLLQTSQEKADRWFDSSRFRLRIRIGGLLGQVRSSGTLSTRTCTLVPGSRVLRKLVFYNGSHFVLEKYAPEVAKEIIQMFSVNAE
jgi:hypothetical protein